MFCILKPLKANPLMSGGQFASFTPRIGDGASNIWFHNWSGSGWLSTKVLYVDIQDVDLTLSDVIQDGKYNLQRLATPLNEVRNTFNFLPPLIHHNVTDSFVWVGNTNGIYTTQSAYGWVTKVEASSPMQNLDFKWIWSCNIPLSIKIFLWQIWHNSLPVFLVLN